MSAGETVFSQLMDHLPSRDFQKCVERYRGESIDFTPGSSMQNGYPSTLQAQKHEMLNKSNIFNKIDWWRSRESNPASALKTLNLPILRLPALQRMPRFLNLLYGDCTKRARDSHNSNRGRREQPGGAGQTERRRQTQPRRNRLTWTLAPLEAWCLAKPVNGFQRPKMRPGKAAFTPQFAAH